MGKELPKFEEMSLEEKRRLAYIDGKEELFSTKVLKLESQEPGEGGFGKERKEIVVVSRDPGSANALLPVVELLIKQGNQITVVVDGRAEEIFSNKFKVQDVTPSKSIFALLEHINSPDAVLVTPSEEGGIEMFLAGNVEAPTVVLEDYYGSSIPYLRKLKEGKLPFPKKVCVMDDQARKIILDAFPELQNTVEVTGQPAFDVYAHEDIKTTSTQTREKLGIGPGEKLVTFMSSIDPIELIERFAKEFAKAKNEKLKFTFRRHPRDNRSLAEYEKLFKDQGIDCVLTTKSTTDEVGAASDLICMVSSTTMFPAIYRHIPVVSVTDPRYVTYKKDLMPLPPVRLGAAVALEQMEDLASCLSTFLNPKSEEYKTMLEKMKENYPNDGNNSKRVISVLEKVLQP